MFRSIKTKLGLLILSFVILVIAIIISTYWLIYAQKEYGLLINLSGRQRMLSQKMTRELHAYTHMRIKAAKNQVEESRALFDQTLKSFRYGGKAIDTKGIEVAVTPLPPEKEIRKVLDKSLSLWNIFKIKINIILTNDIDSTRVKEAINYVEKNNLKLLRQMNLLTTLLQKDYEQRVARLGYFQIFAFILTLFVAFVSYIRLNKIVAPISQLKKATDAFMTGDHDYYKKHCHVKTGDEIEVLGDAVCGMMQKITRDVNELKKVDRMKTEFLSMISHELRTPLTPIKGYLSLLEQGIQGKLSDQQKKTISKIKIQAAHLEDLIGSILDFTRIEFGKEFEIEKEPVSLAQEINEVREGMQLEFEKKEIRLETKIAPNLPAVIGDEPKIQRVITNILGNAVKFTPRGGTVKLEARASETEISIKISDSGIGIPKDELEKIFDKFYQVDSSYTREHGGIGMGLRIAKQFVEAHGGKIWAESEGPGKGSTFIFTLPIGA